MSGAILITGATQPLGRALIEALQARTGAPILACGLEPDAPMPAGVCYVQADLSRARALRQLLHGPATSHRVTRVVHLAFHRRPGARRAHRLHADATRLLLRIAEGHPTIRRVVVRSTAEVYATRQDRPDLLREDHPLDLSGRTPWIRDRVEADVTACVQLGQSDLQVAVLRMAEILAPEVGSQLHDYLGSRVCFRPLGFDPILNLLSLTDAGRALALAALSEHSGVFNIPGKDTLPLVWAIRKWGCDSVGVPGPLMGPLYRARRAVRRTAFDYDLNRWRFHFNGVLDGTHAREVLGYAPEVGVDWPHPDAR